jgi:hypothetical protein
MFVTRCSWLFYLSELFRNIDLSLCPVVLNTIETTDDSRSLTLKLLHQHSVLTVTPNLLTAWCIIQVRSPLLHQLNPQRNKMHQNHARCRYTVKPNLSQCLCFLVRNILSLLSCPRPWMALSRNIPANTRFICDKTSVFRDTITGALGK